MIELGRPGVAVAGALLALLPTLLHFIARRPPGSQPLPTARFLPSERVTRVRFEHRPVDLVHLFLRVAFVLTASLAFAEPRFGVEGAGADDIVLLDVSAAMKPYASAAVDSTRAILARTGSGGGGALVLFDSVARPVADAALALDSLAAAARSNDGSTVAGPADASAPAGGDHSDLRAALEGLHAAAATLPADSARAWIVFVARRDTWPAGLGSMRESSWPSEIGVIAFDPPVDAVAVREAAPVMGAAAILEESDQDEAVLRAALEAIDVRVVATSAVASSDTAILALDAPPSASAILRQSLDAGATVVLGPASYAAVPGLAPIWTPAEGRRVGPHPVVRFADGLVVRGAQVQPGAAAADVIWLAATGDGEPAAVAASAGPGCLVTAAFNPVSLLASEPGAIPDVLERLLRGCRPSEPPADAGLPLDAGALAVLRGIPAPADGDVEQAVQREPPSSLPRAAALRPLRDRSPDLRLVRGLLLLALTAACIEAYLSYGPARSQQAGAVTE